MRVLDKEMAPQVVQHPGARPTERTKDCGHNKGTPPRPRRRHRRGPLRLLMLERMCACLEGWVFVGYIDEDGEEREASYRCRRCASEAGR